MAYIMNRDVHSYTSQAPQRSEDRLPRLTLPSLPIFFFLFLGSQESNFIALNFVVSLYNSSFFVEFHCLFQSINHYKKNYFMFASHFTNGSKGTSHMQPTCIKLLFRPTSDFVSHWLINSIAYGTRRFNAAFARSLQ